MPDFEPLTNKVIACAIEVHKTLGPGLLESVYQECMEVELTEANLEFKSEQRVALEYRGRPSRGELKLDLLVGSCSPGYYLPKAHRLPGSTAPELQ